MTLAKQTMSGGLWSLLANGGQQALNFAFFVYLARLLDPAAFGLVALALVFVDVALPLGRLGLVEVTIRESELDDAFVNRIFWFLAAVGFALMLLVAAAAWPIAVVFGHPELTGVLLALAPVCLLQNLSAVPEARLQRAFGYKALTGRTLLGASIGGAIGLGAALAGFGVGALVLQKFATVLVQVVVLWWSGGWVPRAPTFRITPDLRRDLRMGLDIMASTLMNLLNTKLMDVLIGLFWGVSELGWFRTAWKVFEILIYCTVYPLANVAFVAFTRLRGDADRLQGAYRRMTAVSALVFVPVLLGTSAVAGLLVPLVFGEKWAPSSEILRVLGFMAFAAAVDPFFAPMITAAGRTRALVVQSLVQAVASVLSVLVAAPMGLIAVAIGQVVRSTFVAVVDLVILRRQVALPYRATWVALRPAAFAGLLMWGGLALVEPTIAAAIAAPWLRLGAMIGLGAVLYVAAWLLFFRSALKALVSDLRALRG